MEFSADLNISLNKTLWVRAVVGLLESNLDMRFMIHWLHIRIYVFVNHTITVYAQRIGCFAFEGNVIALIINYPSLYFCTS